MRAAGHADNTTAARSLAFLQVGRRITDLRNRRHVTDASRAIKAWIISGMGPPRATSSLQMVASISGLLDQPNRSRIT